MSIRDWPKTEQPREKLLRGNPATLSDAEILAIFIRTGAAGKSAIDLARELLERYKGLKGILEADMTSFCQGKGLGTAKYVQLQAALELGRRYLQSKLTREYALNDPKDTAAFLKSRLCGYQHEVFACLFLDNRHRLICFEELFTGTIDGASVHPREVVKRALFHNAAALIFAHNHPSGIAEPSQADQNITQQLKKSLSLVDIRVLDHFVIGENEPVSFAERGLI